MEDPRYPIGKYRRPEAISEEEKKTFIERIENLPSKLRAVVESLSEAQLDTPYREGGWTARQVVHHLADSHLNAFIRFKLALTEDNPTIKPYMEGEWAKLPDYKMPVSGALNLLESLHGKWVFLLRSMSATDFEKTFFHPEAKRATRLLDTLSLYAWHGDHHLGHVGSVK